MMNESPTNPFKEGDRVKLINNASGLFPNHNQTPLANTGYPYMTLGAMFVLDNAEGDQVYLRGCPPGGWNYRRFILAGDDTECTCADCARQKES